MSASTAPTRQPAIKVTPRPHIEVGWKVKIDTRRRWDVRGVTTAGRFVILTQPFNARRTVLYTVVDFDRGVRGKDDHYGLGYATDEDIATTLHMFQHTEDREPLVHGPIECTDEFCGGSADVSFRSGNHVRLDFREINGHPTQWNGLPA